MPKQKSESPPTKNRSQNGIIKAEMHGTQVRIKETPRVCTPKEDEAKSRQNPIPDAMLKGGQPATKEKQRKGS
ncbi:hypothetical protein BJX70DRAFT_209279 [Aspergillus crustosus]